MARTSSSWTSPLGDNDGIRMSVAADRNRASVVGHAREDFAAVKVAKAHRLGDEGGKIKMQRNMLARRMVASILKGELDMVASEDRESGRGDAGGPSDEDLRKSIKTILGGDSSGLLDAWAQVGTEDEQVLTSSHGGGEEGGEALIDGHGHGGGGGHGHESHNIFAIPSGGKQQFFWA